VVEDEEDKRQVLRDLLGNAGYELIEAENCELRSTPACPHDGRDLHLESEGRRIEFYVSLRHGTIGAPL
jgi:hypothetical protein